MTVVFVVWLMIALGIT